MSRRNSPLPLINGIRFQLDQLNASNSHHEFEHLCRHLARAVITENLLPATGPVSAGGDQSRDFETFTSFVRKTTSGANLFFGLGESKTLVFACSLQRTSIEKKIKRDVTDIVAGGKPYIIYFFSNQNIAVALRHRVQKWCTDTFDVKLEVLDAQAIAEQLSSSAAFWIAQEYLRVPAELFPSEEAMKNEPYHRARKKWIHDKYKPYNYADFVEVKLGIRKATFNEKYKPDLLNWISAMDKFIDPAMPEELTRRATYEICVAALRGLNNLDSKKHLVEQYFERWLDSTDTAKLSDASVLLSYCTTAQLNGHFQITPAQLHGWTKTLLIVLDTELSRNPLPNRKAELLESRAHACQLAYKNSDIPEHGLHDTFEYWDHLITAAKAAPLYPIERFVDFLTVLAPYLDDDPRYNILVSRAEKILEERSKGYIVAEKSRNRAIELLKAGKKLSAIDQLHRSRVRWFTGDMIEGSVLALLTLSDAYSSIGLQFAAKYHVMGAAFIAAQSSDPELKEYLAQSLHQLTMVQYSSGEWMSMSTTFPLFLVSHYSHKAEPDNWQEHETVLSSLMHYLIARSWATRLGGIDAKTRFEFSLKASSMPEAIKDELLYPPLPLEHYEQMTPSEIANAVENEFWGAPFSDCGCDRIYHWRSLGIEWTVVCKNEYRTVPVVEQFVAVLQIAIVELARSELCLLPTSVELRIKVSKHDISGVNFIPNNSKCLAEISLSAETDFDKMASEILSLANQVFIACSALPDSEVSKLLKAAFKNELAARVFLVRPYNELWSEFINEDEFEHLYRPTIWTNDEVSIREHSELKWPDGPGPGYSKKLAHDFISKRYRRAVLPIRLSLIRYRNSPTFIRWIEELRSKGMLDWQILLLINNAVLNYRASNGVDLYDASLVSQNFFEMMNREETATDVFVPEEYIYERLSTYEKTTLAANAKTWGLVLRQNTPNFEAMKRLLNVRYFQASDDIPHEDFFSALFE